MSRKRRQDKHQASGILTEIAPVVKLPGVDLSRRLVLLFTCLLLVLFVGLSLWEMTGDSVTSDELAHLPAGYAYWKSREFRLNPEHPPLVKLLASAPLLAMNLRMPATEPKTYEKYQNESMAFSAYQWAFGSEFLFSQDADRIMFWGRLPILALGLLLALFVFRWSWQLHGHAGAGVLSLFLLALEPTILAHSHYVTTDVALAAFAIMAIYFLWRFRREGKFYHLMLASLGLGLALAAKFSALFLVPVFFFLLWLCRPAQASKTTESTIHHRWTTRVWTTGWAVIVAAVIVQASYLFSPDLSLYFKSMRVVGANIIPDYPYYVQGRFTPGGLWWYLLYAFLLKTPLPTMVAVAVAGTACVLDRDRSSKALIFLLLPSVIYTLAMCAYANNLGVRYMVPVTAFLLVLSGRSYFVFTASRRKKILAGALAAWLLVSVLRVSPHYISYFNELAGGPENGPYFLDDSNIDWGQDLKRLMRYLNESGIKEIVISYWGPTPPEFYADRYGLRLIPWTFSMAGSPNPPPQIYALSVNRLVEVNRTSFGLTYGTDQSANWLKRFKPSALIGYSIYIYKFPGEGKNPDSLNNPRL